MSDTARHDFILRHTQLRHPSQVPELQLHLADEIMPLWRIVEEEQRGQEAPPPFWAFAWVGGQAVARYVLDHPETVAHQRVVDFATGSGLCAIAALKAGAASALAADIDPFAAVAAAMNAAANEVDVTFTDRDLLDADPPDADLILAGDICYEQPLAGRVLAWLRAANARGIRVLIGDPGRAYLPREGLLRLAVYDVPTTRELEGVTVKRTMVFTFLP
jgi:predicted nicotinamide N-methyase